MTELLLVLLLLLSGPLFTLLVLFLNGLSDCAQALRYVTVNHFLQCLGLSCLLHGRTRHYRSVLMIAAPNRYMRHSIT